MSGEDDLRASLLDAARAAYAARGFLGTSLKGVAAAAGTTPDVLKRYYANRDQLFAAAMRLPFDPAGSIAALAAPGIDGVGERLARVTLTMLDEPQAREQLVQLWRAGSEANKATSAFREFLEVAVVDRVATLLRVPDARTRGALATSYLLGVATSRYVLRLEPLASMPEDELIKLVAPAVQQALQGPPKKD